MANKRGIGIIGCGNRVAGLIRKLLKQYPELEFVGICDPRAEAVEESRKTLIPHACHSSTKGLILCPEISKKRRMTLWKKKTI